ncbi:uncharacterized protein LOC128417266 [Podarcis raffonei]|uniref:uncharacterized protein LOC128417266 n=1 Tax=Podarcis raffonei TaxID=65483 RepID=UPI0023297B64|nr:uncharacterized protein LOC128417266 [Podarcis raffonei]
MAQTGCPWAGRSPNAWRSSGDHRRQEQTRRFSHGAEEEEDDWETDHDYVNNASRPWGDREISTASIISELSRSIRECSLGKPNPPRRTDHADCQSHLRGCKDPVRNRPKDPEGHQPPMCPHVRSSPSLGIERASLFNRNAAEKLDTFFSQKLKARLSDRCGDLGTPQEDPTDPWRDPRKEHAGPERNCRRQDHSRATQGRGDATHPHGCHPCPRPLRHCLTGKGGAPERIYWRQESSRPSTAVSSSARILPRCRISHVQSCTACQAFNRDTPAGMETLQESGWSLPEGKERAGLSAPRQRERTGPPCRRQVPDRFLKVQQWLEETPAEDPPSHPRQQGRGAGHRGSPGTLGWPPAYGSLDQKERDSWGEAGGCPSLDPTADIRHRMKSHQEEDPTHQASGLHTCDDASTSPATCSCLFCEQQRPRATLVSGKKKPDPSAEEVAVQLQAENRIPRIVEAFERRSLREAKIVEREKAYLSARQRELEKRARASKARGNARRGHHQASGTKARKSHAKEEEQMPCEEPRPRAVPEGPPKRHQARERTAKPSFMDRLRGHY